MKLHSILIAVGLTLGVLSAGPSLMAAEPVDSDAAPKSEGADAKEGDAADNKAPSVAKGPTNFSHIGVGVSLGANGLGPTIHIRPIYDGTISLTIVPVVTPSVKIFNGGVKYSHVIARKRQAALYVDGSFGYYVWQDFMKMVSPSAGIGVHISKPYWNYLEIFAELNLGGLFFVGESSASEVGNVPFIPLPAAGLSWYF